MTPNVSGLPDLPQILCVPLERLTIACGCTLRFAIMFAKDADAARASEGGQIGKVDFDTGKAGSLGWPDAMTAWFDAEGIPEPGAVVVRHNYKLLAVLTFQTADEAMAFKLRWL